MGNYSSIIEVWDESEMEDALSSDGAEEEEEIENNEEENEKAQEPSN